MIWTIALFVLAGLGIVLAPISILLVRELFLMSIEKDGLRMKLLESTGKTLSLPYRTKAENVIVPEPTLPARRKYHNGELICELSLWQYLRFLRLPTGWIACPDGVLVAVGRKLLRNGAEEIFRSISPFSFNHDGDGAIIHQGDTFFRPGGEVVFVGGCTEWCASGDGGIVRVVTTEDGTRLLYQDDRLIENDKDRPFESFGAGPNGLHIHHDGSVIRVKPGGGESKVVYRGLPRHERDIWSARASGGIVVRSQNIIRIEDRLILYSGPIDGWHVICGQNAIVVRRGRRFYFYDGISDEDARKP